MSLSWCLVVTLAWCSSGFSPVLQMKVHSRVQVNVCDIQELCIEYAGSAGRSDAEGRGWVGWGEIQPLHCLPGCLAESHTHHPLHLWDAQQLGAEWRQGRVHQVSVGQNLLMLGELEVTVEIVWAAVFFVLSGSFVLLSPVLSGWFNQWHLPSAIGPTSQHNIELVVVHGIGQLAEGVLDGAQVFIESVEPGDAQSRAHIYMRRTFGDGGPLPLFFGICWHLLKRKRRRVARVLFTCVCLVAIHQNMQKKKSQSLAYFILKIGIKSINILLVSIGKNNKRCLNKEMYRCSAHYASIWITSYLHSLWAHPIVHPFAGF